MSAAMSQSRAYAETIVLLAEYYGSGGTRTYLRHLLDFYAVRGTAVVLVGCHAEADAEVAGWLADHGFSFVPYAQVLGGDADDPAMAHPSVWSPTFMRRERAAFRRFTSQTGAKGIVVTAGTPGQFAGAAGASESSIYILHTYPHGRRQETLGRWLMHGFFRPIRRLVAVSAFQQQAMTHLWRMDGRADDMVVIPNTTGPIVVASDLQEKRPLDVITASWLEPYKEPLEWLDVATAVTRRVGRDAVRFTWLGEGSMLDACRQAAAKRRTEVDATFAGHSDDVDSVYRSAAVYLQLSSTENMSLSVIDALRFGVPAVATDVGGLPEIVDDGSTGLLIPVHDVDAAAGAVTRLLTDAGLRASMAATSQARYAAQFAPDRWTERMSGLHDEVFGPAPISTDG